MHSMCCVTIELELVLMIIKYNIEVLDRLCEQRHCGYGRDCKIHYIHYYVVLDCK